MWDIDGSMILIILVLVKGGRVYMSHVVNYRVLSHVLRLHSHRILKVLSEKRAGAP